MNSNLTRVLCVDDEPNLLSGLVRQLRGKFDVVTAVCADNGLETFSKQGPFPIVVSDMRMPGTDGAAFLGKIRKLNPDTVRILLTGETDLGSAISAVNEGHIFRFLTKPCPPDVLIKSLEAATEQHRLITSEKVLLEQTLRGSIKTLTDVLALSSPEIFARANRMKVLLKDLLPQLQLADQWPIEVAVLLSQIGAITLPDEVLKKVSKKIELQDSEKEMVAQLPLIGEKLLSHIPRLEPVREILRYQEKHFDGTGFPADSKKGNDLPLGARILKILLDYERLEDSGCDATYVFDTLRGRKGWYDTEILNQLAGVCGEGQKKSDIRELPLSALQAGMILVENVFNLKGICLVKGNVEITETLLARMQNIAKQHGIKEPIRVKMPGSQR